VNSGIFRLWPYVKVLVKRYESGHQQREQKKQPAVGHSRQSSPAKADQQGNRNEHAHEREIQG
jgi:hypothetical protein